MYVNILFKQTVNSVSSFYTYLSLYYVSVLSVLHFLSQGVFY